MWNKTFTIYGEPVAKGRPRFRKIGKFVSTYTPKKTKDYESECRVAATCAMYKDKPLLTPVKLVLEFQFAIPKSYSKKRYQACLSGEEKHLKKPDLDNIGKLVMDAFNGIVYKDDSQIVCLTMRKRYSVIPCILVTVSEVLL